VPSDGESKPLTADEPAVDQLSFIDLLYAVPIGDGCGSSWVTSGSPVTRGFVCI
jgi:hypothetical protein